MNNPPIIDIEHLCALTKSLQDKLGANLASIQCDVERLDDCTIKWKAYHGAMGFSGVFGSPDEAVEDLLKNAVGKLYAKADALRAEALQCSVNYRQQADALEKQAIELENRFMAQDPYQADRNSGFVKETAK